MSHIEERNFHPPWGEGGKRLTIPPMELVSQVKVKPHFGRGGSYAAGGGGGKRAPI